ncbi:MAG: CCA tRNA nucleotidyltransferase [Nitrospirae bacterium]|nr:CCA tRNA nucleotidyltransferase [Nitrospirota bacterium]
MRKSRTLYERAVEIVRRLSDSGHKAYFAGGSVRDQIRGKVPTDYDIATSARPEEVRALFPEAIPVGVAFGVVLVPLGRLTPGGKKEQVEIATFRSDGIYLDGRHPESVIFSNEKEDANRRDFTINGMFFDPLEKRLIDYVGGKEDLASGIIRTIGDPELRFKEDFLRMLRAVRFAAQFSFEIESRTFEVIRKRAGSIRNISGERIRDEMGKILLGPSPERGIALLEESGILGIIFPELKSLHKGSLIPHALKCFHVLNRPSFELGLALLVLGTGDLEKVRDICGRLKLSNLQIDKVTSMMRDFPLFQKILEMDTPTLKRFLRSDHMNDLLSLYRADCLASGMSLEKWEYAVQKRKGFKPDELFPPTLLNGDDLIRLGYSPGPRFKKILYDLETRQLNGKIRTVAEAEAVVLNENPEKNGHSRKIKV